MLLRTAILGIVVLLLGLGAVLAQQPSPRPPAPPSGNAQGPQTIPQSAGLPMQLERIEKAIASLSQQNASLGQQIAQLNQQIIALETKHKQEIGDVGTRLQTVQNSINGLVNVQAQTSKDIAAVVDVSAKTQSKVESISLYLTGQLYQLVEAIYNRK